LFVLTGLRFGPFPNSYLFVKQSPAMSESLQTSRREAKIMEKSTYATGTRVAAVSLAAIVQTLLASSLLGAATPVACGDILSVSGQYVLTGNLVCNVNPAIRITASDVHLNMAGYTLTGGGSGRGILVSAPDADAQCEIAGAGPTGVHINGGTVTGYAAGITLCNADGNHVNGMSSIGNAGSGIVATLDSDDNVINGNILSGNQYGLLLLNGSDRNRFNTNVCDSNVRLAGSVVQHSGCVFMADSSNNTVSSNEMTGNGMFGVEIARGGGNTVRGNTIVESRAAGIRVLDTEGNTIRGNTCDSNMQSGIALLRAVGNRIQGNTTENNRFGIRLDDSTANTVQSNTALSNMVWDLFDGSAGCDNTWKSNTFVTKNVPCIQ
jgi:parallel beta-helix repeat protein